MEIVKYNGTVGTDDLVLKHQVISSYSADYTPMCF